MPFLANWLWLQLCGQHYRRFLPTLDRVEEVQREYLLRLVHRNSKTKYGRRHEFADISSVDDYQRAVPLTHYEDYLSYVEEIAQGETGILTAEPVFLFQPSSGTSSASKLIPYTKSLESEFQRAIGAWVTSIFNRKPKVLRGTAYWSITPPIKRIQCYGKVPVGFAEDAEYLGFVGSKLYSFVSAVPRKVTSSPDTQSFLLRTLVYLLAADNLALVSVWSPTFLLLLLRTLLENQAETLDLLANIGLPRGKVRADTVRRILQQKEGGSPFECIWPNLGLISCWTHGLSEIYAKEVQEYFPSTEIEGKGLIATEAFVSLPFAHGRDPVLAVDSHFFEFRDVESDDTYLAHELSVGKIYSVVISTGGGLYRYQLGDLVRVTGFIGDAPTLRFVTKEMVSDFFGEKLHSEHVQRSAATACATCSVEPSFFLLAPVKGPGDTVAYCLFLDIASITTEQANSVRDKLETLLRENFHYAYCQDIGQLGSLRLFLIDRTAGPPEQVFTQEMHRRGLKLGDIKPAAIDHQTGWEQRFRGRFINAVLSGRE